MFQQDLLKDKVILVTGGGTGLGRSMSERFLALGAKVAIASRRQEVIEQTTKEMQETYGGEVFGTTVDVRDYEQIISMIDAVEGHYGHIDVLLNNAAGNFISPTERLSHRAVDSVLGIVLHGTFYCTLEMGKRWIEKNTPGTVLNIATTYALTGSGYVVPSSVAKAGVVNLTRSLAAEWGKHGIRLNAIAPGPFPTEGAWSRLMPTKELETLFMSKIPLGRVGKHEELADLASFMVSEMAAYMTGEVVVFDGGESVWGAGEFNALDAVTSEQWDQLAKLTRKGK